MADQSDILQTICQHSSRLQVLNQRLSLLLPATLRPHCYLANIHHTEMMIHVDNAVWATRLRFLIPDIILNWQQDKTLPFIKKIAIHIDLSSVQKHSTTHQTQPTPISKQSAVLLHQLANQMSYEKLQTVLHRLANRSQSN